ncbi:hypothetical protein ACFWJY_12640 [Streptomyces anulatus]|uniref:hypothetical protein n=1 Tax=Streptomyces anulatus TaxID=1892 RepID=UPI00364D83CB
MAIASYWRQDACRGHAAPFGDDHRGRGGGRRVHLEAFEALFDVVADRTERLVPGAEIPDSGENRRDVMLRRDRHDPTDVEVMSPVPEPVD